VEFDHFTHTSHQEIPFYLFNLIANGSCEGKQEEEVVGKLDIALLIKVIILPLSDKYNCFQLAKRCSTFSIMLFQRGLALREAP
jgi:hypothetical protein